MTPQEAIKNIEIAIAEVEWKYPMQYAIAFEIAIKALEKQMPKKPIKSDRQEIRYTLTYDCPTCGRQFTGTGFADYCYHCGQALDWSDN